MSDYQVRVEWVKTLKELFSYIEANSELELTTSQHHFRNHFLLIDTAWASSRECFFAGWPSEVKTIGSKKFCTSPLNIKSDYQSGGCRPGQLQCQPLLFGKNICVRFNSPAEKSSAFAKCEEQFRNQKKDHSFLKELTAQEANDLQNLSVLAHKVCEEGSVGIQHGSGMCKKLMSQFKDGMLSIARSQNREIASIKFPPSPREVKAQVLPHRHGEECPPEHLEVLNPQALLSLTSARDLSIDHLYETFKKDFQKSAHCEPQNVLHDPRMANSLLMKELIYELGFLDYVSSNDKWNEEKLNGLLSKFHVQSDVAIEAKKLFQTMGQSPQEKTKEIKRIVLQDYANNAMVRNSELSGEIAKVLAKNHIFKESGGKIECPFMSKDAFSKAFKGMQKVKSQSGVKNKDLLTIVDYTQPSNNRRLYVLDLKNNKVMHNTWVAHGGGGNNVFGSDGIGGSPGMSNRSGSNQSSDGFVVASTPSYGSRFGNNLILNGVDRNNGNMRARAVIMHGWDSPGEEFVNGLSRFRGDKPIDVQTNLERLTSHSSKEEVDRVIADVRSSTFVDKILRPTEGCLGVPRVRMPHLDPKSRNKPVIDVLREDLAQTVIFNYSGPAMKSTYF